jgi:hypothetical protein
VSDGLLILFGAVVALGVVAACGAWMLLHQDDAY